MYESYPWPGAYTLKGEIRILSNWVKELLNGVFRELRKPENKR